MSVTFWITSLVIVLTPGTGALYTLGTGLVRGPRAAVPRPPSRAPSGSCRTWRPRSPGSRPCCTAAGSPSTTVKYAGVVYLLWMAWHTWRETGSLRVPEDDGARSGWRVISTGIMINLLNPKLTIFFFAFLPQFVPAGSGQALWHMLGLSAIFMAMTFVVFVGYGMLAAALRERVLARPRLLERLRKAFAGCFAVLGARLALESR